MKYSKFTRLFWAIILFLFLSLIYLYRLNYSFSVNTDFGRDIFEIQKIVGGNFTLIGPMLSAGFFASPLYFYFFAPVLALFPTSPISIVYANALIFSLSFAIIFYCLSKKHNLFNSLLFILVLALLHQTIHSARYPGNAFSYSPFLITLLIFPLIGNTTTKINLLILGVISFVCLSFHPISIFGIMPLIIWLFQSNKKHLHKLLFFFIPAVSFILPTILFEIKHNFIISKGFILALNQVHPGVGQSSVFQNLNFVVRSVTDNFSLLIIFFILASTIYLIRNFKKYSSYEKIISIWSTISFLIFIFMIPKYESHYLIPLNILLAFTVWQVLSKTKLSKIRLSLFLIIILLNFPVNLYKQSTRPLSEFANAAKFVSNKYPKLKSEKFNIIQISDQNVSVPTGHEYRFFLKNNGFFALPETDYSGADSLLVFSEEPNFNVTTLNNWEINQFGKNFIVSSHDVVGNIDIYLLTK